MARRAVALWIFVGACTGGGGPGPNGDGFQLDYHAGPELLLEVHASADLGFTGTQPSLPALTSVAVAQAHAVQHGDGQQILTFRMSSTTSFDAGDRFSAELEFSRANDGDVLDAGGTLNMACRFFWNTGETTFAIIGDCDVHREGVDYVAVVTHGAFETTELHGTFRFGPVASEVTVFSPDGGCNGLTCVSLDPAAGDPMTGYCLPPTNLKSDAEPCDPTCTVQLDVEVGGARTCVCSAACGRLASGGGDPPVCDPAYGCIDI